MEAWDSRTLEQWFGEQIAGVCARELGTQDADIEGYLAVLLVRFLHTDAIFSLRDAEGRRLEAVADMLEQGDVRLKADSFQREREVHRHIGDFLMFWHGVYPEFLRRLRTASGKDWGVDYPEQGRESYHLVSTFDFPPHDREAPVFRRLSAGFEAYATCLGLVHQRIGRA